MGHDRRHDQRFRRTRLWARAGLAGGAAALVLTGSAPILARAQQQALTAAPLMFDNVTVVDVAQGKLIPAQRVVVVGNRIQAMGAVSAVKVPQGAQVVDARGKYLMPGLWDMHVHVWDYPDVSYPLLIANGVTGIREMSQARLDSLLKWRREILAGTRVGPRIVGTGGFLSMPHPTENFDFEPVNIEITDPEAGRRAVDSLKASGADFIKIRGENAFTRASYFAVAAEARRLSIPLVGHLPDSVTPVEASDSGQRTLDHYTGRGICSGQDSIKECKAMVARLVRNGTWVVPTLAVYDNVYMRRLERLRYWPASARSALYRLIPPRTAAYRDSALAPFRQSLLTMHRFGVPLLAGSDPSSQTPEITPGLSLHDELRDLVEMGLTPLEALQAATLSPARFFNATDSLGTVAKGKLADLLLLDADPIADIHNATKIRAVVANGRYFDRGALDKLLEEVEANANVEP